MSDITLNQIVNNPEFKKEVAVESVKKGSYAAVVEGLICPVHLGQGIWPYLGLGGATNWAHKEIVHGVEKGYNMVGVDSVHSLAHETVEGVGAALLVGIAYKTAIEIKERANKTRRDLEDQAQEYIESHEDVSIEEALQSIRENGRSVSFTDKIKRYSHNPSLAVKVYTKSVEGYMKE
mgnify:CR=1 FL=1